MNAVGRALAEPQQLSLGQEQARLEICAQCPFFEKDYRRCGVCQCFVDFKASLGSEKCPKGFW